jgi:membrane fusion protein, multidrug efflux system
MRSRNEQQGAWLRLCGTTALLTAAIACGGSPPAATPATAASAEVPSIEVTKVVEEAVNATVSLPGEMDGYESVSMYPKVTGFIKTIVVDRGTRVRAGQILATLDAPEVAAQRAEAQSRLQNVEAQLVAARAKADADAGTFAKLKSASATPGVVAGNELMLAQKSAEASQSLVAAAEQSVAGAREALNAVTQMESYLTIIAPFAGVITERNVHPGALVGPGSGQAGAKPIVRLVEDHRLRLVVPVPESYSASVKQGSTVAFAVPTFPGQSFSGTIARISRVVDVTTRTMAVELEVPNADGRLAPGTFCQVKWPVSRPTPSLFVPPLSVASTTDRTFVVRVANGKAEWVDVKTGLTVGALVEVFGALHDGDAIAVRGTDQIRSGADVKIKEPTPAK